MSPFLEFFERVFQPVRRLVRKTSPLLISLILFPSCDSQRFGVLYDFDGLPLEGHLIRIISVNDQGEELAELDSSLSGPHGRFAISLESGGNASIRVAASLPQGTLRGFLAGRSRDVPVHPLTEAVVSLVQEICSSSGGRSNTDFSANELRGITEAVFDLDTSSLDLGDAIALKNFLRTTNVARRIALASGGAISASSTESLENETLSEVSFSPDVSICGDESNIYVLGGTHFRFDVMENGSLCGGSSPWLSPIFYSGAFELKLPGEVFFTYGGEAFPFAALESYVIEDQRELRLGPYALRKPGTGVMDVPAQEDSISVTRKIYAPENGDYVRFLTALTNDGAEDRLMNLELRTFLMTDDDSTLLTFDASDASAQTPNLSSRFLAVYDRFQDRPSAGFIFQDGHGLGSLSNLNFPGKAGGQVNEVSFAWSDVLVPAGTTRTILSYGFLSASRSADDWYSRMVDFIVHPDMDGLDLSELQGLMNFSPNLGTIWGDAGSVIGEAQVTGVNERTSETLTVSARTNGSFALPLPAETGDTVHITATDGLDTTITIP